MSRTLPRSPIRHRLTGGVTVVLFAATGCGGSTEAAPAVDAASASGAAAEFGLSTADLGARIDTTEKLIATCMTDAGFEYTALDAASVQAAMASDKTATGVRSEDFVKQFGLGITTQLDKPIVTFGAGPQNTASLNALAAPDEVAYRRALWGDSPDWNHARAVEEEDFSSTSGCTRTSADKAYTPSELNGSYVNPNDQAIEQDPRMVAAEAKWADCMKTAGFAYNDPGQVDEDLHTRLDTITNGEDPRTLSGSAATALKELQGAELVIAAALTTCEEDHIEPVQAQVETEVFGAPQT